jgi:voltage-gated potassium channel
MKGRFLQLLVALLLYLLLEPLFEQIGVTRRLFSIFLTVILMSALFAVSENKTRLGKALLFGVPALVALWGGEIFHGRHLLAAASPLLVTGFLAYVAVRVLSFVIKAQEVEADTIYAALCVYLLLGLVWALFYMSMEQVSPGSLRVSPDVPLARECVYYSYVTLTTLGYGDVTPLTPTARSFSFVEALMGQLYLAVLVARLVGLHIAHAKNK